MEHTRGKVQERKGGYNKLAHKKIEEVTDAFWKNEVNEYNKELIEEFLSQQHLSPATLQQYESGLKIFAKWVHDFAKNKDIVGLKARDALKYQNWLISKDLSSNAIKFKRSVVSSFCGFIELYYNDEHPMFRNIFTKAIPNVAKANVKEKNPLTKQELELIIETLKKREEYQKLAFLLVAYSSAGRRAEVIQLKKEIVNYQTYKNKDGVDQKFYLSHVVRGKGRGKNGKDIRLMISKDAMNAIKKWIEVREQEVDIDGCEYIFVSKAKDGYKQISLNTVNLWVDYFGDIIGRKINPHLIRASRSTHIVVDEGKDVRFAQRLLHHESSETTNKHYIIRDENEDLGDLFS